MQIQAPNIQEDISGKEIKSNQTQDLHWRDVRFKDQRMYWTLWFIWGNQNHIEATGKASEERTKKIRFENIWICVEKQTCKNGKFDGFLPLPVRIALIWRF